MRHFFYIPAVKKAVADLGQLSFVVLFATEFTGLLCGPLTSSFWLLIVFVVGLLLQELHQYFVDAAAWRSNGFNWIDVSYTSEHTRLLRHKTHTWAHLFADDELRAVGGGVRAAILNY